MPSAVLKRSVVIEGVKTSVSIEDLFWSELRDLARQRGLTVSALVASIKAARPANSNLSSAIRVHILAHLCDRLIAHEQARETAGPAAAGTQVLDQRRWVRTA